MRKNEWVVLQIPGLNLCLTVKAFEAAVELGSQFEPLEAHRMYEVSKGADGFLRWALVGSRPASARCTAAQALDHLRALSQVVDE